LVLGIVVVGLACGSGKATRDGGGGSAGGSSTGGTGGGSACSTVSPCGGDVVGTWQATQSCLSTTEDLSSACAGASATITFNFAGTMTFGADLTYTSTSTGGGTTRYHYPGSCIPSGYTCAQYGQLVMAIGSYSSVDCATDAAGFCNCDAVTASVSSNESGTYATSGVTLTTMHGGATSSAPYCVQGNLMYLMQALGDGGVQTTGSVVLERQ
jgi:hypothetical protein